MLPWVLRQTLLLLLAPLAAAAPITLRVLSYNIHHGEGLDGRIDLPRIAQVITDARADLVALQEVDRGVPRSQRLDLPAELGRLTGLTPCFEKNIPYQGGDYGNAILTRFPIKSSRNTHYKMLRPREQRGLLQVVLDVQGRDVVLMNTHLDYRPDDTERVANVAELQAAVAAAGAGTPVIVCGDFNATPGSRPHAGVETFLADVWSLVGRGDGFSFPARAPAKRIDYIWISRKTIEPVRMEVLRSEASDHLPLLAELRLR